MGWYWFSLATPPTFINSINQGGHMTEDNGNNPKEQGEQDSRFLAVPKGRILNLKLGGMSDRAVAKKLNLAHSTVNKHYHKELTRQNKTQERNLENLRFQQYLRFERLLEVCFEQLGQKDFRATQWATITAKVLSDQSRLYGLNTGDTNINIDNRQQTIEADGTDYKAELNKRITNHVKWQVKYIVGTYLLGEEYKNLPEQDELLKEYLGDMYNDI